MKAYINNKPVPRASRGRPGNRLHYNPAIEWLLNQSRGELGEKGQSFDPSSGGGGSITDNWPSIERLHNSIQAVERWRKLNAVFARLTTEQRVLLKQRYRITERSHSEVRGLVAAFSDLATLAWHLCADKETMRVKLCKCSAKSDKTITALRHAAEQANREIHIAWLDAEREIALEWVEGGSEP